MNIRDWPLDKIMQLPDHVFGRRWPITFSAELAGSSFERYISPMALPERCVLWQIYIAGNAGTTLQAHVELALGDQDPVTNDIFDNFEQVFQPNAGNVWVPRGWPILYMDSTIVDYRYPIMTSGRRFAIRADNSLESGISRFYMSLLISSFPTEVPEWLS